MCDIKIHIVPFRDLTSFHHLPVRRNLSFQIVFHIGSKLASAAGKIQVMEGGFGLDFDEDLAKKILSEHDITVIVKFYQGEGQAKAWGCDLTYDYVKINGDYRT